MPQVIYYVAYCIMIVAYVITTTLAIKRKKPTKSEVVEPTDRPNAMGALALKALDFIHMVEVNFSDLFREGAKAGQFKLDKFLDYMKKACEDTNVVYDQKYWQEFATDAVTELLNFNKYKTDCQLTNKESALNHDVSTIGIKTYGGNK